MVRLRRRTEIPSPTGARLRQPFALGNVAVHDDQLFGLAIGILDDAGSGFQDEPCAVLVTKAVFQSLSNSRTASIGRGILDSFAIVGVNLLEAEEACNSSGEYPSTF